MRVVFILSVLLSSFSLQSLKGQQQLSDSVKNLQEVDVYAPKVALQLIGNKLSRPSKYLQLYSQGTSLNDILQHQANIQMKSYGNGMLSTIAFRGTTASQTSVLWNDFNINNYSLGLTDFSLLPINATEEILLLPGGGSSYGGNGAIGGTVVLIDELNYEAIHQMNMSAMVASFGKYQSSLAYEVGNNRWAMKTQLNYQQTENDFFIESIGQRQKNAAFRTYGLKQEIGYKLTGRQQIDVAIWYNHNEREVQTPIRNQNIDQFQIDDSFRSFVRYKLNTDDYQLKLGSGFFKDDLTFIDAGQESFYSTKRAESFANLSWFPSDSHLFTAEVRADLIEAYSDGFNPNKVYEQRYSWQVKATGNLLSKLEYSAHIGQQIVSNTAFDPFTPYVGLKYALLSSTKHIVAWKANSSYNYRVPTLNDRFWELSDRPKILPERGLNVESGFSYQGQTDFRTIDLSVTAFKNHITNYIQWVPVEGQARPMNVAQVNISGLEVESNFRQEVNKSLNYRFSIAYALNDAQRLDALTDQNSYLVYVPKHKVNIASQLTYRNIWVAYFLNYSSEMYTTEANSQAFILDAYMLHDIGVNYQLKDLRFAFKVKNVLNTAYQTYLNYAMPGRNFELSVNYKLNLK